MAELFNKELAGPKKAGIWETLRGEIASMSALDKAQVVTDAAGLFDPTPISGIGSTLLSAARLDLWGVGLGLVGMLPYLGDAAKLGKIAKVAPKTAKVLEALVKGGEDFAKMGKDVIAKLFTKPQIIAARQKATEAVRDLMRRKRIDPNCVECKRVKNAIIPEKGGTWTGGRDAVLKTGNGTFVFDTPKLLPDGKTLVTSIDFKDGFPVFDKYVLGGKHELTAVTGQVGKDMKTLEEETLAATGTALVQPKDYTLHHFENGQVGYVPSILNNQIPHLGGNSIINDKNGLF